jgi:hypothetical protein
MKALFTTFLLLSSILFIYGQKDSVPLLFNEFNVSLNRTVVSDNNTKERFGFGIGIYRSILNQKKINLIFGLEYNISRQFKKKISGDRWTTYKDVEYRIQSITLPFNIRFNIGKSVKFFIDAGGFVEVNHHAKAKGVEYTGIGYGTNYRYYIIPFNEARNVAIVNYGFTAGFGIRIPVKKTELIIKTDYKHGFRDLIDQIYPMDSMDNRYIRLIIGLRINKGNYKGNNSKTQKIDNM